MTEAIDRRGLLFGISAYTVWGFFPIFMALLAVAAARDAGREGLNQLTQSDHAFA